jgi:hypothetical protein
MKGGGIVSVRNPPEHARLDGMGDALGDTELVCNELIPVYHMTMRACLTREDHFTYLWSNRAPSAPFETIVLKNAFDSPKTSGILPSVVERSC